MPKKKELNQNVKLWVEALRSGKYNQCRGSLRTKNRRKYSYCALGVAMKVAETHGVIIEEHHWDRASLPYSVMDWLGLRRDNFQVKLNSHSVIFLNDTSELDFKEIAKQIELHPTVFETPKLNQGER